MRIWQARIVYLLKVSQYEEYIHIYYTHVQLRNCRLSHISQKCTTKIEASSETHVVQLGQSKSFSLADTFCVCVCLLVSSEFRNNSMSIEVIVL